MSTGSAEGNPMIDRRLFLKDLTFSGLGLASGCALSRPAVRPTPDFLVAELIHLGENVQKQWGTPRGGVVPDNIKDPAIAEAIETYYLPADHLRFQEPVWEEVAAHFRRVGVNAIVLDLAEGVVYPSHPELAVRGSWSPEKLRAELDRMRSWGFEPIPKLNFSTGHNCWMGDWARMVSSRPYYRFCEELIADVIDLFDGPRYFHIGCDEERIPPQTSKAPHIVVRQGEHWYADLNRLVAEIERQGARAWMWSDAFWTDPEGFVRHVPRTVLQSNWYYRSFDDERIARFSPKRREFFFRCRDAYLGLEKAGYDQIPCSSNFYDGHLTMEGTACYALEHLTHSRVKGLMMASWYGMNAVTKDRICAGADQLGEAARIWRQGIAR